MVNLESRYDLAAAASAARGDLASLWDGAAEGIWRYRALLPVGDVAPVSLSEGGTPLVRLARLGEEIGVAQLYAKDEARQPTASYKDRLASVLVTKARELGAPGVVVSSTGNHGAAIAAYAARADLPCIVFTLVSVPATMKTQMQAYGAMVVALERPTDRWVLMRKCAEALRWMPTSGYMWPPLGTPAVGMEGYKSIAYELLDDLGQIPDWVVVPTSYGDGIYGIWKGFRELREMGLIARVPRMAAAEALGPLARALEEDADAPVEVAARRSISFSIATPIGTYQALQALRESGGAAAEAPDEETRALHFRLAAREGLYSEPSSVTAVVAAQRLAARGRIRPDERVVLILTSSGLKDTATTAERLPDVPLVAPELSELQAALASAYGFRA